MANYRAQSRVSSVSTLRSTDAPIKSAPNLAQEKTYSGHIHKKINRKTISQRKKLGDIQSKGWNKDIRHKSAAGKIESRPFSLTDSRSDTVEEFETSLTESRTESQMNVTKTRNDSQMSVTTNRSKSQMSVSEIRSESEVSFTSDKSSRLKNGTGKKNRKQFPKNLSKDSSLRMLQAGGICGNDGCSLCLMAKCLNQGQVNTRFGGKFQI